MNHADRAARRRRIARDIQLHESVEKAMKDHKVSRRLVLTSCREYGVSPRRSLSRWRIGSTVEILMAARKHPNRTPTQLAQRLSVTRERVRQVIEEAKSQGFEFAEIAKPVARKRRKKIKRK